MRPLLARIREHSETRSIGRAICALFLLTGLIGAFASGTAAAQSLDNGDGFVHCLSGLLDEDHGEYDGAANCCTLGCPMVTAALPAPAGPELVGAKADVGEAAPIALVGLPAGPVFRFGGDGPRGPPLLV